MSVPVKLRLLQMQALALLCFDLALMLMSFPLTNKVVNTPQPLPTCFTCL